MTDTTALTVAQRAAVALNTSERERALVELAGKSKAITTITNADGRQEAHAAAMALRATRVEIEKAGKDARDDATRFSKAVIAEQQRLVALIEPEEERLLRLRDAWDAERERERQAKIEAERQRVQAIRELIASITRAPLRIIGMSAAKMIEERDELRATEIVELIYEELTDEALSARDAALATMDEAIARQQEVEAEQARLAEQRQQQERQRAELEQQRKAEEERQAAERARLAEERRLADEARAKADAEAKAARAKADAEAKAARDKADAEARAAREKAEAEARAAREAEEKRLAEQRAELERQQQKAAEEERQRKAKAEAERLQLVTSDPVRALREIKALLTKGGDAEALVAAIDNVASLALGRIDAAVEEAA